MIWPRRRRTAADATLEPHRLATAWQVASLLLDYPTDELVCRAPTLRAALAEVPPTVSGGLTAYLDLLETSDLVALQQDYVDTFDVTRKCSLHLTYFLHGDTRRRGLALVQVKQAYRQAGVEVEGGELPDYLPVVLEFGAAHDADIAMRILTDHRAGVELLHRALQQRGSRWLGVLDAVRATLPTLDGTDEEALARLIAEGPPSEDVGLDQTPYSVMTEPSIVGAAR